MADEIEKPSTKKCPHCQTDIPLKAQKCPHCQSDLRGWVTRHSALILIGILILLVLNIDRLTGINNSNLPKTLPVINQEQIEQKQPESNLSEQESQKNIITDEEAIATIKTALKDLSIITKVVDGRPKEGTKILIMSYRSIGNIGEETGRILGTYFPLIKSGWDTEELLTNVADVNGKVIGMWGCDKKLTNDFIEGKISKEDVILQVLNSMQSL